MYIARKEAGRICLSGDKSTFRRIHFGPFKTEEIAKLMMKCMESYRTQHLHRAMTLTIVKNEPEKKSLLKESFDVVYKDTCDHKHEQRLLENGGEIPYEWFFNMISYLMTKNSPIKKLTFNNIHINNIDHKFFTDSAQKSTLTKKTQAYNDDEETDEDDDDDNNVEASNNNAQAEVVIQKSLPTKKTQADIFDEAIKAKQAKKQVEKQELEAKRKARKQTQPPQQIPPQQPQQPQQPQPNTISRKKLKPKLGKDVDQCDIKKRF